MRRVILAGRVVASVSAVAAITALYVRTASANPTTVALTYVVAILLIATQWGIAEATIASLAATLSFNYFFLPPVGRLTIADPQNWVALTAFLATAIVASQLSGRARQRNIDALSRQRDLERLYALSRALLLGERTESIPSLIAQRIASTFELSAVALYDHQTDTISRAGSSEIPNADGVLRDVARQATSFQNPSGLLVTAIRLGGAPIGSLAIVVSQERHGTHGELTDTVFQSIANLAAIGLERARGQEAAARAEAARQSGELRATVLDALAHEFKTPLTSMKAAAGDLLSTHSGNPRDRELVLIIDEDLDRLQALVTDAVQMLRIDAGDFKVHRDRQTLAGIVRTMLSKMEPRLDGHAIMNRVPDDLVVDADRDLLGLALRQLIDNAVKYSPATSTIELAASNGSGQVVEISVKNSGPAIPEREQARIFERFYRGTQARHVAGTGMGLAIVQQIARAHGGALTVASGPDTGTTFTVSLPRGGAPA
jgi:two-component system sensor histidine kinase KdpD